MSILVVDRRSLWFAGALAVTLVLVALISAPVLRTPATATAQGGANAVALEGWMAGRAAATAGVTRLVMTTVDGRFEVDVDAATRVRAGSGEMMPIQDVRTGMQLRVSGEVRADARVDADELVAGPPPPPQGSAEATVRGRVLVAAEGAARGDDDLLVIVGPDGETAVEVGSQAVLLDVDGQAITFAELRVGDNVRIRGSGRVGLALSAGQVDQVRPSRPSRLRVEGILRARAAAQQGAERWVVGTAAVTVTAQVAAGAQATIGQRVSVRAERGEDGELLALEVALLAQAVEEVELRGTVQSRTASTVTVEGLTIAIDGDTEVEGQLEEGAFVGIRARVEADGELTGEQITVLSTAEVEVQFEGDIESIVGTTWQVAGTEVRVDLLATVLTGLAPVPGLHAEVTGTVDAQGVVEASRIHVESDVLGGLELLEGELVAVTGVPGTWRIAVLQAGGVRVEMDLQVTQATIIDESRGAATVGAEAQVHARAEGMADLTAEVIRIRREDS